MQKQKRFRSLFFSLPLMIYLCSSCGPASKPPDQPVITSQQLNDKVREAGLLVKEGKLDEAENLLLQLTDTQPELRSVALLNIAGFCLASNELDRAMTAADEGLTVKPDWEPLLLIRGRIFQARKQIDEAEKVFLETTELYPESIEAHFLLGQVYWESNRLVRGASQFQICIQIDPNHGAAHHRLALALRSLGKEEEALKIAERATQLLPDYLNVHRLYQDLAIQLGHRDRLIQDYFKRVEENPDSSLIHYLYGRILDDPEAAQFRFELASQMDPQSYWPHYASGIQHFVKREYDSARTCMKAAEETATPDAGQVQLYLALIDMADNRYSEAEDRCLQLLEKNPGDARIYTLLHEAYLEQEKYDEADRLCEEIQAGYPGAFLSLSFLRLRAAYQKGDEEGLRKVSEYLLYELRQPLPPQDRELLSSTLAWAVLEKKDYVAAEARLSSASQEGCLKQARSRFWLGWLKEKTGQPELAIKIWKPLADSRSRWISDEDLLYVDAARYALGEMRDKDFTASQRFLRYSMLNDSWAILGLKAISDNRPDQAKEYFNKALEASRGNEFPARLVKTWLSDLG